MKSKILLPAFLGIVLFSACSKETNDPTTDIATETDLAGKQAFADYSSDDVFDMLMLVGAENPEVGAKSTTGLTENNFIPCANVSISSGAFPKTITIDFGDSCMAPNGVVRSGIISIVVSDSLRLPGSTATTTFNNYYINHFKKEGTIVWSNQSTGDTRKWNRTVTNGKITAPGGAYWTHNGTKTAELINDTNPNSVLDNIWSITGSGSTTNSAGVTRSHTIVTPLIKKVICSNIVQGTVSITGPHGNAMLDYGNGECDNQAVITLPNGSTHTITLP